MSFYEKKWQDFNSLLVFVAIRNHGDGKALFEFKLCKFILILFNIAIREQ